MFFHLPADATHACTPGPSTAARRSVVTATRWALLYCKSTVPESRLVFSHLESEEVQAKSIWSNGISLALILSAEAQEEDQELRCVAANQFHRPFKSSVVVVYRMLCCVVVGMLDRVCLAKLFGLPWCFTLLSTMTVLYGNTATALAISFSLSASRETRRSAGAGAACSLFPPPY